MKECKYCNKQLPVIVKRRGRPRLYCGETCRQYFRQDGMSWNEMDMLRTKCLDYVFDVARWEAAGSPSNTIPYVTFGDGYVPTKEDMVRLGKCMEED